LRQLPFPECRALARTTFRKFHEIGKAYFSVVRDLILATHRSSAALGARQWG
jgi:hypothetical protein